MERAEKGTHMKGRLVHHCIHVMDLEASLEFYEKALGLTESHRMGPEDGSWVNVYVANELAPFEIEFTWNRGRTEPYENAGKDVHFALRVPDIDAAYALHSEMGCVLRRNDALGIYSITDPDGQLIEILPER
jgi:lactoylglutathione lyase